MAGAFVLVVIPCSPLANLWAAGSVGRDEPPKLFLGQCKAPRANVAGPAGQFIQALAVVEEFCGERASLYPKRGLHLVTAAQEGIDRVHPGTIGAGPAPVNPDTPQLLRRGDIGNHPDMISIEHIEERMKALGLNPFSAAKKAGLGQDYVRDILRGKVKEPSASKLRDLANALECSTEYLQGVGEDPGERPTSWSMLENLRIARLVVEHEIRDGFHRHHKPKKEEAFSVVSYSYAGAAEWLELVRDPQLENQVTSGTYIHAVGVDQYFDGLTDIVVYEKSAGQEHLSTRRLGRLNFSSTGVTIVGDGDWWNPSQTCSWDDLKSGKNKAAKKVVGLVIRAYQFFNGDFNSDEMF